MIQWLIEQADISEQIILGDSVDYVSVSYNQGRRDAFLEVLKYIENNARSVQDRSE